MNSIEIENLNFSYSKDPLFSQFNLNIPSDHNIVALMGPSGCGKSTLLNIVSKLLVGNSCNRIKVLGMEVKKDNRHTRDLRAMIATIFQTPSVFPISIEDNIKIVLEENTTFSKQKIRERVQDLISEVGLYDELKNRMGESALNLSGGQKQRLCIARALAKNPSIILMDEPCSSLDPISTQGVEDLIRRLSADKKIILVTHNLAQAKRLASYGILLWHERGRSYIEAQGELPKLMTSAPTALSQQYFSGEIG